MEAILGSRKVVHGTSDAEASGESMEYLVKWVGYSHDDNSWEPAAHVTVGSSELVQEHHGAGPEKRKAKATLRRSVSKVWPLSPPYPTLPYPTLPYTTLPWPYPTVTLPYPAPAMHGLSALWS